MGQLSRISRNERFIKEFSEDIERCFQVEHPITVKGQFVAAEGCSEDGMVRFGIQVQDKHGDERFFLEMDHAFFDPQCFDEEELIERLSEQLQELPETVAQRLLKADLITEDEHNLWREKHDREGAEEQA